MALGMVSFTLGGADRVAFAVYSADDGSLNFYKRMDVPEVGDTFEDKIVTEVYTGFENTHFSIQTSDDSMARDWTCNALPWWNRRDFVKTATVVDTGITPTSICGWFMRMPNLRTADLSNLDCVNTYTAWCAFLRCTSLISLKSPKNFNPIDLSDFVYNCDNLKDLDTSTWNMGRCQNIGWAFSGCHSLESLPGAESWNTSSLNYTNGAFAYCDLLKLDCSDWKVQVNADHKEFNHESPGVILPKPWQPTAFSVFSADDGSLDFYKREFKDMPKAGETFEGRIVTNVYTGFEESRYMPSHGNGGQNWLPDATNNTPWFSHHLDVTTVSVIDEGIRPKYLNCWFQNFQKCRTFDLNKLDMSSCSSLYTALSYCTSATDISVSSWDVSQIDDFTHAFLSCESLETLDLSGWNTSSAKIFHSTFNGCSKLKSLLIGSAWNFSHVWQCRYMFSRCANLTIDCSEWDVSGIKSGQADELETSWHFCFNYDAPGVILPKPWQAGAFAIYSADDDSLDFYKRSNCELPVVGSTFEGKSITEVYTSFEKDVYTGTWPDDNCPWFDIATKVESVTVVDTIKPRSMAWWFNQFTTCTSFDLGNVDTSECISLRRLFSGCQSCTSIAGLDNWDTGSVTDLSATFDDVRKLKTIPGISVWNTGNVKYFAFTFFNLAGLEQLDLSNWDDSSMLAGVSIDGIGRSNLLFGSTDRRCSQFKSFTIGMKWGDTSELAAGIEGAGAILSDGKWYAASDGSAYKSTAVPSNRADTYYATPTPLQSAIAKEPADWTLDDQHAVADDISAKGEASPAYAKAKGAMDAGTEWSMKLTDGKTLKYRIIGISHDDLADGSGKARLTFLTTSVGIIKSRMNTADTNAGGWATSELRQKMNSGDIWSLMSSDFKSKVKMVKKLTNNVGGGTANKNAVVSATVDKLFLLSYSEIVESPYRDWTTWSWIDDEGTQYESFQGKVTNGFGANSSLSLGVSWWERSVRPDDSSYFLDVSNNGNPAGGTQATFCVLPAWCF